MATQDRSAAKADDATFPGLVARDEATPDDRIDGIPPGRGPTADNDLDRRRGAASGDAGVNARTVCWLGGSTVSRVLCLGTMRERE